MPIETMPGTSFQDADDDVRITAPTANQSTAMSMRKPGLDGRRPGCPRSAGELGGRICRRSALAGVVTLPREGRGRPPVLLRAPATR